MIKSKESRAAIRPGGNHYPDFPLLPNALRDQPGMIEWHRTQTRFWDEFRLTLDRSGVGGDAAMGAGGTGGAADGDRRAGGGQDGRGRIPTSHGRIPDKSPPSAALRRIDGSYIFYQDFPPGPDQEPREGDLWFNTTPGEHYMEVSEYRNGQWQLVFGEVPTIDGLLSGRSRTVMYDRSLALLAAANARTSSLLGGNMAAVKEEVATLKTSEDRSVNLFRAMRASLGQANARITLEQKVRATNDEVFAQQLTTVSVDLSSAQAAILTEQTARISADGVIEANLATEVLARQEGYNDLSASISLEQTARIEDDEALADSIGILFAEVDDAYAAISTEQTARADADNSLKAEYVLQVETGGAAGRRVTGFRITNLGGATNETEFIIQTDKFVIVDDSGDSPTVPFKVTGGQVYIDKAVITEVSAGAIQAGTINADISITTGRTFVIGSGSSQIRMGAVLNGEEHLYIGDVSGEGSQFHVGQTAEGVTEPHFMSFLNSMGNLSFRAGSSFSSGGTGGGGYLYIYSGAGGPPQDDVQIHLDGNDGLVTAVGFVATSSRRWKKNIRPITRALDRVLSLRGYIYDRTDSGVKNEFGVIAEEAAHVVPSLVSFDQRGRAVGVQYDKITALLIEAIRELADELHRN